MSILWTSKNKSNFPYSNEKSLFGVGGVLQICLVLNFRVRKLVKSSLSSQSHTQECADEVKVLAGSQLVYFLSEMGFSHHNSRHSLFLGVTKHLLHLGTSL